jgi:hypothetical protein
VERRRAEAEQRPAPAPVHADRRSPHKPVNGAGAEHHPAAPSVPYTARMLDRRCWRDDSRPGRDGRAALPGALGWSSGWSVGRSSPERPPRRPPGCPLAPEIWLCSWPEEGGLHLSASLRPGDPLPRPTHHRCLWRGQMQSGEQERASSKSAAETRGVRVNGSRQQAGQAGRRITVVVGDWWGGRSGDDAVWTVRASDRWWRTRRASNRCRATDRQVRQGAYGSVEG